MIGAAEYSLSVGQAKAGKNILERIGVVHPVSTPVKTALPVDTPVSAKRIVEAGRRAFKERTASAVSE
jgi:putative transposase